MATLDDVDELVRLRGLMFDEMDHPPGDPAWREACAAFLHETMATGTTVNLHATGDGEPIYRALGFRPDLDYPEMRWDGP